MINYNTYNIQYLVTFRPFQAYFVDFAPVIDMVVLSTTHGHGC